MTRRTSKIELVLVLSAIPFILPSFQVAMGDAPSPALSYVFGKGNRATRVETAGTPSAVGRTEVLSSPEALDPDELSAAFWIRFNRLPSRGTPTGLFDVSADRDGYLAIRLFAKAGEFPGDYEMKSRTPVKKGAWHHVEFTYSKIQWRASLYLDGRFQWENDDLHLPSLRLGPATFGEGFSGALRDFDLYDMALPSECLAIAEKVPERAAALADKAKALAARTRNAHLRAWLDELAGEAGGYAAAPGAVTIHRMRELELDLSNAEKIAGGLSDGRRLAGRIADTAATVFTVKPLSQELFLPRTVPENGELSGRMEIAATRGEYENGSALVFAFRPVTVSKVTVSDLKGPDGAVIPAREIDVKLVKRWFRTGGAWLSYHSDRRQRNLTPDLLIHDDDLVRVDEWRRRNYLRLDYPEGRRYEDVSDPAKGHVSWRNDVPFRDAKTLRPVKIGEAGRNQQFLFTLHVPGTAASGLYKGRIAFEGTGAALDLVVRVLPFDLPSRPATYYSLDKTFMSHMNRLPEAVGPTTKARETYMREMLAELRSHNLFHATGLWDSRELVALAREAGFSPDKVFGRAGGCRFDGLVHDWRSLYPGVASSELTKADKEKATACLLRMARPWRDYVEENLDEQSEPYVIFCSETRAFEPLSTTQAEEAGMARKLGQKVFAHGWYENSAYAGDIQDMHSITYLDDAGEAAAWHAGGGELISYSDTFPGNENPCWFRRRVGLRTYKAGYDGQMLHGFLAGRIPWNEFSHDPGGDGNYRNFRMLFPQQDGFIAKLAFEGYREAFDDLRYATRLRQLALANRESKDELLRRECRRQLIWLERLDGRTADLDMARRTMADDICLLQDLIRSRKGVLPPADKPDKR